MPATVSLKPLTVETASAEGAELLEGAKKNLGFIPNMYAEMAHAPGLLSTYLHGYDWFRRHSGFTPAEQETVFLAISRENACHYCVAAHSMIGEKISKMPADALQALREGHTIPNAKLQALAHFSRLMVKTRGNPAREDIQAFVAAGYSEAQALQVLLAIAVKTISNYNNHLFDTPVDAAFAAYTWKPAQAI